MSAATATASASLSMAPMWPGMVVTPAAAASFFEFDLVAHGGDRSGIGADEGDAGFPQRQGEIGPFRQKAVAGMDGIRAALAAGIDDVVDDEVGGGCRRRSDIDRLVGAFNVKGVGVHVAVDGDRRNAKPARRPDHPDGDLTAVGNQNLREHAPVFPPSVDPFKPTEGETATNRHTPLGAAAARAQMSTMTTKSDRASVP